MANEMIADRYIIVRNIGSGGMADVYLAIDSILKREVAVKVLHGDLAQDPINLARFQKEALAIANTSHPNIVEIYDVGEDGGKNYIVMEYVHGKTLKQLVKARGVIGVDEAVNIMKQLVSATAHAHKNGIIHRDIKSQNVLVKDDGTVKLSDFGIAYTTTDATQINKKNDTVMGSVHYLAPELAQGETPTVESDIYSLGIVFYELLTGDVPYHGDTAVEIALKHMHNDVPYVREFDNSIPQSVENIIIRSTARKLNQRYSNASDMYNDLVTCLDLSRLRESRINLNSIASKAEAAKSKNKQKQKPLNEVAKKRSSSNSSAPSLVLIVMAVVLSLLAILMLNALNSGPSKPENKIYVPDLYLADVERAKEILTGMNITIDEIVYEVTDDIEKGKIIRTSPAIGSELKGDLYVTLYVSKGMRYTVGNYIGKPYSQIEKALTADGFNVFISYVETSEHENGTIISQSIQPGKVMEPSEAKIIYLEVATYVSFVIPNSIESMNIDEAVSYLQGLGATVEKVQLNIEDNMDENGEYIKPIGVVVSCTPAIGTLYSQAPGVKIILYYY